jgi:hypothetical protein
MSCAAYQQARCRPPGPLCKVSAGMLAAAAAAAAAAVAAAGHQGQHVAQLICQLCLQAAQGIATADTSISTDTH